MADYKTEYEMPWVAHSDFDSNGVLWNSTYHLVLENGITRIGNNAFYGCLVGELKIPSSVYFDPYTVEIYTESGIYIL